MSSYPPAVLRLIHSLKQLPSIGARSAERLALHLLDHEPESAYEIANAIREARDCIRPCTRCGFFAEADLCLICQDQQRLGQPLCVVQHPADVLVIERSQAFRGYYHVLGGVLSPLDGIGPEDLRIQSLKERIQKESFCEVILALGADVRAETTSLYLLNELRESSVTVTQLATGISVGGPLEFADSATLAHALEGRKKLE